jgi:DNA-directed RNA polymerase specialized sigma24 family protein
VLKFWRQSEEDIENDTVILYEKYLPRVFQYVNYWLNDTKKAEDLTMKTLKKALIKLRSCAKDKMKFSQGVFSCARNEIWDYLKVGRVKPILSGLSTQEQEVISLKLAAEVNNQIISKLLGLSELKVDAIVYQSLCKLRESTEVPA